MKCNSFYLFWTLFLSTTFSLWGQVPDSSHQEWFSLNGYIKNMHSAILETTPKDWTLDGLIHQRFNLVLFPQRTINFNAGIRNRVWYGQSVKKNPFLPQIIEEQNTDYFDLSHFWIEQDNVLFNTNLDRLYLDIEINNIQIRLGRQRIDWGIATLWNPNDLFNNLDFTDFDYLERTGVDAAKITWFTGPVSRLEAVLQYKDHWDTSTIALMYRWNWKNFDYQILTGSYLGQWSVGSGFTGYLGNLGWKTEANYIINTQTSKESIFNATTEFNYYFANELYFQMGYIYNERGQSRAFPNQILKHSITPTLLFPYRHGIWWGISYPITPLFTLKATHVIAPMLYLQQFFVFQWGYELNSAWNIDFISQIYIEEDQPIYINSNTFGYHLRLQRSF